MTQTEMENESVDWNSSESVQILCFSEDRDATSGDITKWRSYRLFRIDRVP
jgi:hypothetical protein